MKNNVLTQPAHSNSLVIRWIAATALVVTVGAAGFLMRGSERHERKATSSSSTTRALSASSTDQISFPDIPEFEGISLGERAESASPDPVPAPSEDFARCEESPTVLRSDTPSDWSTYRTDGGASFGHPAGWDASEEGEQAFATSPDGSRAFIVDVIDAEAPNVSFSELFTNMATLRPTLEYSDPRPVLIDGKRGCAVKLVGDGHSGRIVVLRFNGGFAVLTVGYELNPPSDAVADGWSMLASFRIGS